MPKASPLHFHHILSKESAEAPQTPEASEVAEHACFNPKESSSPWKDVFIRGEKRRQKERSSEVPLMMTGMASQRPCDYCPHILAFGFWQTLKSLCFRCVSVILIILLTVSWGRKATCNIIMCASYEAVNSHFQIHVALLYFGAVAGILKTMLFCQLFLIGSYQQGTLDGVWETRGKVWVFPFACCFSQHLPAMAFCPGKATGPSLHCLFWHPQTISPCPPPRSECSSVGPLLSASRFSSPQSLPLVLPLIHPVLGWDCSSQLLSLQYLGSLFCSFPFPTII